MSRTKTPTDNMQGKGAVEEKASSLQAILSCLLFVTVGPTLIFVNKIILKDLNFPFPVTLSAFGVFASCCFAAIAVHGLKYELPNANIVTFTFFMMRCMPIGMLSAMSLYFGNKAYLYLPVSFIQMLKAFTPAITLVILYFAGLNKPTPRVVGAVFVIASSTSMAAYGELNFNMVGFIIMMCSVFSEAFKMMLTQKILSGTVKLTILESMYFLGPAILIWMLIAMVGMELNEIMTHGAIQVVFDNPGLFFLASVLGTFVNLASFLVIKTTNALTLKTLAAARNAALVLFCALFLGETVTMNQGFWYCISLVAFCAYNYFIVKGL